MNWYFSLSRTSFHLFVFPISINNQRALPIFSRWQLTATVLDLLGTCACLALYCNDRISIFPCSGGFTDYLWFNLRCNTLFLQEIFTPEWHSKTGRVILGALRSNQVSKPPIYFPTFLSACCTQSQRRQCYSYVYYRRCFGNILRFHYLYTSP